MGRHFGQQSFTENQEKLFQQDGMPSHRAKSTVEFL